MYRLTTFAGRMRTVVAATRRGWALAPSERMARHCCQGRRHYGSPAAAEPFLSGSSGIYVEEMYNAWLQNPASVHKVSIAYMTSHAVALPGNAIITAVLRERRGSITRLGLCINCSSHGSAGRQDAPVWHLLCNPNAPRAITPEYEGTLYLLVSRNLC